MQFLCCSIQNVWKQQSRVITLCDTLIELGDEGPYAGLVAELKALIRCTKPKRFPSGSRRKHARKLKSLLKGLLKRIKHGAVKRLVGLAQIVDTELSGEGGCSMYKRLDAQLASLGKASKNLYANENFRNYANQPFRDNVNENNVGLRGGHVRGAPAARRGAGRGGRDRAGQIICFGCHEVGHIRSRCPERANAGND